MVCKDRKAEQNTRSDSANHNHRLVVGILDLAVLKIGLATQLMGKHRTLELMKTTTPYTHCGRLNMGTFQQTLRSIQQKVDGT